MSDERLADALDWKAQRSHFIDSVQEDLQDSFDDRLASWVKGENRQSFVAVDNALYVMYCLWNSPSLSSELDRQRKAALNTAVLLMGDGWELPLGGIPLFSSDQPEAGPTVLLIELSNGRGPGIRV